MESFDSGKAAVESGMKAGDEFTVRGELRKVADNPGEWLTRGEFGDVVYSLTATVWDQGEYRLFNPQVDDVDRII